MPRQSAQLVNLLTDASSTGEAASYGGGACVFVRNVGVGGSTLRLEMRRPQGAGFLVVQGTAGTTDQVIPLELPAGDYRAAITGGTAPAGYYASLLGVL